MTDITFAFDKANKLSEGSKGNKSLLVNLVTQNHSPMCDSWAIGFSQGCPYRTAPNFVYIHSIFSDFFPSEALSIGAKLQVMPAMRQS